jgi:hypothetical protein
MAKPTAKSTTGLGAILGYNSGKPEAGPAPGAPEATLMDLLSIMPDPGQPRTLLPADLYERLWAGDPPEAIMKAWLQRTTKEGGSPAQRRAVEELNQLAATIEVHGLIHPINVRAAGEAGVRVPSGITHLVVTGERRWWAHVLLLAQSKQVAGNRSPRQIQATILPAGVKVRALQLIENMQRAGLSAIERADGLEELRRELSEGRAQPASWTEVQRTLGIDKVYRWRIQQVLNLSDKAKELVRWHGLTEKAIRPIVEKLQDRPDLQIAALNQLIAWQEANEEAGNKRLLDLVQRLLQTKTAGDRSLVLTTADPKYLARMFSRRVNTALKVVNDLDKSTIAQVSQVVAGDHKTTTALIQLRDKLNAILGTETAVPE